MTLLFTKTAKLAFAPCLLLGLMAGFSCSTASAQRAGSWINLGGGQAGAGASASGSLLQFAKSKSSSKNGVDFGHGFAVGANHNGISISNTIGAGAGGQAAAHNLNMHIGANGTHLSHGGVTTQGGRVISGGQAGSNYGRVYGGSSSTGYGQNTKAWSDSHTRQWGQPAYQTFPAQQNFQGQPAYQSQPAQNFGGRVFRNVRF